MDSNSIEKYVNKIFPTIVLPELMNFIRIPNISPEFDPEWRKNGYLLKAAQLIINYANSLGIPGAKANLLQDDDRSPFVFIDIPGTRLNDNKTILMYGHFDKMPVSNDWDPDKDPRKPVIIDGKLYGRGSADDGYASFSALAAIKCCVDHGVPYPRLCVFVEGCEESNDEDLKYYFQKLKPTLGNVALFFCIDSGCEDHSRLYLTSTLRGAIHINIKVTTLDKPTPGMLSGIVPDNYMIINKILSSLIDENGEVLVKECKIDENEIKEEKKEELRKIAEIVGEDYIKKIPLYKDTEPLTKDVFQLLMNKVWRPSITMVGYDGLPEDDNSGNTLYESQTASLDLRIPPGVDANEAFEGVKKTVLENTLFGATVEVTNTSSNAGWSLEKLSQKLKVILNEGSKKFFGNEMCIRGEGGSIPFNTFFQQHFPDADLANIGICAAENNEHGPNEHLDIEACKKIIMTLAHCLSLY